jgi:hypothetical protein
MDTGDDFREVAECCYLMGLATNNVKWSRLAEEWLRQANLVNRREKREN